MVLRAAIYTRISKASDPGDVDASTARQERLCRQWLGSQGYRPTVVYSDELSASNERRPRPQFEALLRDVRSGRLNLIVAWRVDRFVRQVNDFERLLDACREGSVLLRSVTEEIDAVEPMKVAMGRMMALFASYEGDIRSLRWRAREIERAQRGEFPRQGVYGLSADGTELVADEVAVVREAAARVLGGEYMSAIAADFARRGVTRRDGLPHTHRTIRQILRDPGIWGARHYKGTVVAEDCWPAVLDPLYAAQVRYRLDSGGRRWRPRALLSGMLECECGGPMTLATVRTASGAYDTYRCQRGTGCGRHTINRKIVETMTRELVLTRLSKRYPGNHYRPWNRDRINAAVAAYDRYTGAIQAINSAYFWRAEISRPEWYALRDSIALATDQTVARLGYTKPPEVPPGIPPRKLGDHWDDLTLAAQRAVMKMEIQRIVIITSPDLERVSPRRLVPVWVLPDPPSWSMPTAADLEERRAANPSTWVRTVWERSTDEMRRSAKPVSYTEADRLLGTAAGSAKNMVARGMLTNVGTQRAGRIDISDIDRHLHWRATRDSRFGPRSPRRAQQLDRRRAWKNRTADRPPIARTRATSTLMYTTAELSEELGISTHTLINWARQGAVPSLLLQGRRVYPKNAIGIWLAQRSTRS